MKKFIPVVLTLCLALCLAACGGKSVTVDTEALAASIEAGGLFVDTLAPVDTGVVKTIIGVDTDLCESCSYSIGSGNTGEEYGIFVCSSEADAKTVAEQLEARKATLHDMYESYAPEALVRIDNAVVKRAGVYVAFVSADDYSAAADILNEAFAG